MTAEKQQKQPQQQPQPQQAGSTSTPAPNPNANHPMFGFFNGHAPGSGVDHQPQHPFAQFGHWGPHAPPPPPPPPAPGAGPAGPHPPPPPGGWAGGPGYDWNMWFDHDDQPHGRRYGRHAHRHGHNHHHRHGHGRGDTSDDDDAAGAAGEKGDKSGSPETMDHDAPDPEEVAPEDTPRQPPPYGLGRGGGRFGRRGRGGPHCRRGRGGSGGAGFDFPGLMRGFMQHPFFQNLQAQYGNGNASGNGRDGSGDDGEAFAPPVDVFNTADAYVVHVALPGANKDDIGVNWNPDEHALSISGVVHRPGDEHFIQSLVSGERRVGLFERTVTLPPVGVDDANSDIDADRIFAKMDAGVLVVSVPKVEKEWTEVRKVDIQ